MSVADALTAQGMATRHKRSVKAVIAGVGEINALLAKMLKGKRIKYGGFGTHFEWFVRKLKEKSSWKTGQLASRTFEEKDPVDEAKLPYCFIDETYGVSEKSIKTNRAAGSQKIYDIQQENARNAQTAMYRAIVDALYSNGDDGLSPVGLMAVVGDAYETTDNVTIDAGKSYAGISLNASKVTAWNKSYSTMNWNNEYWYPTCIDQKEVPGQTGSNWSVKAVYQLQWMVHKMSRTADVSGTGKIIKPDMALMATDPWSALVSLLVKSQMDVAGIPIGTTDTALANFVTIRVGGLDCVFDENVPDDQGSIERVLILDTKAFYIETLNSKSEGLIEGDWKQDDPEVVGGVGMYKSNMGLVCHTPQAVGVITGCDA